MADAGMTMAEVPTDVPAHVPPHLIWNDSVDTFPMAFDDPYVGACDAIHRLPDIVWAAKGAHSGRPGWLLTRHADMEEVYCDSVRFSAAHSNGAAQFLGFDLLLLPAESDPPDHKRYRQILQPFFNPSAIDAIEPMVREICAALIARFEGKGGCEFVADFSHHLPATIFLSMMGMPLERLPIFFEWEEAFVRGKTREEQIAGTRALFDYMREFCAERRRDPGDDLVSKIVTAQADGRPLSEMEAIGICMTLYFGGLDTVMNVLGWCLRHLARDRPLQDRLRAHPEQIPLAVDELLRAYAVTSTFRTVMEDIDFHGVPMRRGDIVAIPTVFAARDDRRYANPHIIDIDRRARHLSFGSGVHNCLGIHLARREVKIVLESFLSRFRNIRIPEGERETWSTAFIWGVRRLPLEWDSMTSSPDSADAS